MTTNVKKVLPKAEKVKQDSSSDESRLKKKWGTPVLKLGWTGVPNILIESQQALELNPLQMNILFILLKYWWNQANNPFPSKKSIAEMTCKDESTIRKNIKQMQDKGLLKRVTRNRKTGGQDSNAYDLSGLVEKLKLLSAEKSKILKQREEEDGKIRRGAS